MRSTATIHYHLETIAKIKKFASIPISNMEAFCKLLASSASASGAKSRSGILVKLQDAVVPRPRGEGDVDLVMSALLDVVLPGTATDPSGRECISIGFHAAVDAVWHFCESVELEDLGTSLHRWERNTWSSILGLGSKDVVRKCKAMQLFVKLRKAQIQSENVIADVDVRKMVHETMNELDLKRGRQQIADREGQEEVQKQTRRIKFLNKKRRSSSKSSAASSGGGAGGDLWTMEQLDSFELASVCFELLETLEISREDVGLAISLLCSEAVDVIRSSVSFLETAAKRSPVLVGIQLLPHLPHCKQPSSEEILLFDYDVNCHWINITSAVANIQNGLLSEDIRREFFTSCALFCRDHSDVRTRLKAICAMGRCPWDFCSYLELPSFPEGEPAERVLFVAVRELSEAFKSDDENSLAKLLACQAVKGLAEQKAKHAAKFSMPDVRDLDVFWPYLVALHHKTTNDQIKVETINALIWVADETASQQVFDGLNSEGSFARQIKAFTTSFNRSQMGHVLETLKERMKIDRNVATLSLDLAVSRFSQGQDSENFDFLLNTLRDCIQVGRYAKVLQEVMILLDDPFFVEWKAGLLLFIWQTLDGFLNNVSIEETEEYMGSPAGLGLSVFVHINSVVARGILFRVKEAFLFGEKPVPEIAAHLGLDLSESIHLEESDRAAVKEVVMSLARFETE